MTPGSSLTLSLGDSPKESTLTAGHYGYIRLQEKRIEPGTTISLSNNPTFIASEKKQKSNPDNDLTPGVQEPRTSAKSIERRKIQIEALRDAEQKQQTTSKTSKSISFSQQKSAESKYVPPISTSAAPDELEYLRLKNQIALKLSQGFQNILDQITNNPLAIDDIFKADLPPLPPPQNTSLNTSEAISLFLSQNKTLVEKTGQLRTQLLQFLNNLPKPSYKLSPVIPDTIQNLTQSASQAYKKQDWDQAIQLYQKALEQEPSSLHALSNLGVVYFSQGNYEKAEKTLKQALQQAPHDAFSYSILGISALQQNHLEESLQALISSVILNTKDAQAQNYLAMALTKKGWLKPAEEHGRESLLINPNSADAHYNLAQIYANQQPIARELAKKHYSLSVNLGGIRDETLENTLQIKYEEQDSAPQIQVNP